MPGPHFENLANESDQFARWGKSEFPAPPGFPATPSAGQIMHNGDRNELAHIGVHQEEFESD